MFVFSGLDWVVHCQLFGEQSRVGSMKIDPSSGAGMNLKVGGGAPLRRKSEGHQSCAKRSKLFLVIPSTFFGSKSTIRPSRFGERFRDGQYSLVRFLFAILLMLPPCPAICKNGGVPPVSFGVGATGPTENRGTGSKLVFSW